MTLPNPYPVVRYRLAFEVETALILPGYAGSTLRGAFGGALKHTVCLTRQPACAPCPLYRTCPYPLIFETPPPPEHALQKFSQIPNGFVVEPPPWGRRAYAPGEALTFHLVLVGQALAHLPLIIHAWQRALSRGVGKDGGRARLMTVVREAKAAAQLTKNPVPGPASVDCATATDGPGNIFSADEGAILPHSQSLPLPHLPDTGEVHLTFLTPLRLQHQGRPIGPDALTPRDFLVALARRLALLTELHAGHRLDLDFSALAKAASLIQAEGRLTWRDWRRWSNRQRQTMALGGVVGEWRLAGELAPFLPFLYLGQWLHAGKNATFGLGRYLMVSA